MTDFATLGIRVDTTQAVNAARDLDRLGNSSANAERNINDLDTGSRALGGSLQSLARIGGAVFAGWGISELLGSVFNVNRELNSTRQQLANIEGSAGAAAARFSELGEYSIAPIVGVKALSEAYLRLKNLALDANQSILTSYANIAASNPGKKIGDVIEAVADAATGEFERLKEFGIKASQAGGMVSLSFQGATTTIKNNAAEIQGYLQNIGNTNFAGAVESQLQTIDGAIAHLKNSAQGAFDNLISDKTFGDAEAAIAGLINTLADAMPDIINAFAIATAGVAGFAVAEGVAAVNAGVLASAMGGLEAAMLFLTALNPLSVVIAALTAAAGAAYIYRDAIVTVGDTNAAVADYIESAWYVVRNAAIDTIDEILSLMPTLGINAQAVGSFIGDVFRDAWRIVASVAQLAMNAVIGAVVGASRAIGIAAAGIVQYFAQAFDKVKSMAAGLALGIEAALAGDLSFSALSTAYKKETISLKAINADIKSSFKDAFKVDYVGDFGKKIKEGATQIHSLRTMIDANALATSGAKKSSDTLAGSIGALGNAHKAAAGHARSHSDAQKEINKVIEDARRLTESLATPTEKYNTEITNLQKMLAVVGPAFETTFVRGLAKASDELLKNTAAVQENIKAVAELKAALDLADYATGLQGLGLSQDAIKAEIEQYKQLRDAISNAPTLPPGQVAEMVAQRIKAEDAVKTATNKNSQETSDFAAKAWEQAARNVQDALGNAIEGALTGKGMQSFSDFASSVKDVLYKTLSQSISAGIIDGLKSKDWGAVFSNLFLVGVGAIASWLTKSAPTLTASASQTNNTSTQLGSGAQAIGDSVARQQGFIFETKTTLLYNQAIADARSALMSVKDGIFNAVKDFGSQLLNAPVVQSVKTFFQPLTDIISNAWTGVKGFIGDISSKVVSWVSSTFSSAAGGVNTALSTGAASSLSDGVVQLAGKAMAVIGAVYSVYSYFSNLGALIDTGSVALIAGNTAVMVGSVILAVAAVSNVVPVVGQIIAAVLVVVGLIASLFAKVRVPNYWINQMPNLGDYQKNANFQHSEDGLFTVQGNKSSYIGTDTAFGEFVISSHEMSLSAEQMTNQFKELIFTVKAVDQNFANTINKLDEQFGQTGQTMAKYTEMLSASGGIKFNQNASDLSLGEAVDNRYQKIVDMLAQTGTTAGQAIKPWFDMFMSKLPAQSKADNPGYSMSIIQALSSMPTDGGMGFAEMLTTLPANMLGVINDSVRTLKQDNPFADLMTQVGSIIVGYMQSKLSFAAMGDLNVNDERIVGFIGQLNAIGVAASDSTNYLIGYALALSKAGAASDNLSNVVFDALDKVIADIKARGLGKDQLAGYLSTFTLGASAAGDAGVSATQPQLDALANRLNDVATSSTQAANELINHTIADNNLGTVSRESAIQQLVLAGKLKDSDIQAANFGIALTKLQQTMLDGIGVATRAAAFYFTTLGQVGIGFESLTGLGDALTRTFGDVGKAASWLDNTLKTVLTPDQYNAGNLNAAQQQFNSAASNMGLDGLTLDQFKGGFAQGLRDYFILAGSANAQDQQRAAGLKQLSDAGVQLIQAEQQMTQAANSVATSMDALVDKFKDVNDRFNALQFSDLQQNLNKIRAEWTALNQSVVDSFVARGSKESDRPLADNQIFRNTAVAIAEAKTALGSLYDEFNAIGKSDVLVKTEQITQWYSDTLQSVSDVALVYNITNQQAIDGITKIRDARMAALQDESNALSKIKDYVQSLKLSDKSPLTYSAQFSEARAQFGTQLALAKSGDKNALDNITQYADTYLSNARRMYSSSADYTAIFNNVSSALEGIGATPGVDQSLEIAKQQRDYLKAIADYVTGNKQSGVLTASSTNGGYTAFTSTPAVVPFVGPAAPVDTGVNVLSTFNRLLDAGNYTGAADVAKNSGYSMPEVAGYVEQTRGISASDTMAWFAQQGLAFANGGTFEAGTSILVGDNGPEILQTNVPGRILNATQMRQSSSDDAETKALLKEMIAELKALRQSGDTAKIAAAMDRMGAMLDQRGKEQVNAQRDATAKLDARKKAVRLS